MVLTSPSLKQLLNLDKAEAVFQGLLEVVEAHSTELCALKEGLASKADTPEVCSMCGDLRDRLVALEARVSSTEAAIVLPGPSPDVQGGTGALGGDRGGGYSREGPGWRGPTTLTIGEIAWKNSQVLRMMGSERTKLATKDDLKAKGEELEALVRARERCVRQWGVGRDFADSLGQAQRGLAAQLEAVEGLLATKLDKADVDNVKAACAKVSTVSEFLDDASERVSNLEAGLAREGLEWRQRDNAVQDALQGISSELNHKAESEAVEALEQDLLDVRKAFIDERNTGRRQLRTLQQGAEDLKDAVESLTRSNGERLSRVEGMVDAAATREELTKKADLMQTQASIDELSSECSKRALQTELSSLGQKLSSLAAEHAKTRRASDLAARFVDWFSSRGEAYEHNLGAVEKHMEKLAVRSVGARACPARVDPGSRLSRSADGDGDGDSKGVPYSNSVRFTPM